MSIAPRYVVKRQASGFSNAEGGVTQTIESGRPIYVNGLLISNGTGANRIITLQSGDGSTVYGTFTVPTAAGGRNIPIEIPFYAAKGLQIVSNINQSTMTYIIFYSHPGA